MNADGANARQITHLSTEAGGMSGLARRQEDRFQSSVYPECGADDACNKNKLDADAKNKVKARIYTSLLYRHWTEWQTKRRQHLLVMNTDGTERQGSDARRRTMCLRSRSAAPTITPSRRIRPKLAFTMNVDPNPATSTNSDIYTVPHRRRRAARKSPSARAPTMPAVFARRKVSGVPLAGARRL